MIIFLVVFSAANAPEGNYIMSLYNLPIRIEYHGKDASHDMLDLRELAISLDGTSKLLRMSSHLLFAGEIPETHTKVRTKFYARPTESGCFPIDIIGSVDGDMFSVASEVVAGIGAEIIQRLISIAMLSSGGRPNAIDPHFEALMELTNKLQSDHVASQEMLIARWAESEGRMFEMAKMLGERGHAASVQAIHPVGRTCSSQKIGDQDAGGIEIDLPTAQSIRSSLKLEVGEMEQYNVLFDGMIIHNKTCRLIIEGEEDRVIPGDLVDPVADGHPNIYTQSMGEYLTITAKPTFKDGQIYRLAVYDAKKKES